MKKVFGLIATVAAFTMPTVSRAGELREFIAFFPKNSAALDQYARKVIDDFIAFQKACGFKVALTGHTDTTGPSAYNLHMSELRVKTVANYLTDAGIAKTNITMAWLGEASPAYGDGDDVEDPLNRRVTLDPVFGPGDCMENIDPVSLMPKE